MRKPRAGARSELIRFFLVQLVPESHPCYQTVMLSPRRASSDPVKRELEQCVPKHQCGQSALTVALDLFLCRSLLRTLCGQARFNIGGPKILLMMSSLIWRNGLACRFIIKGEKNDVIVDKRFNIQRISLSTITSNYTGFVTHTLI